MHILHLFYMILFPLSTYPGLLVLFTDSTSSSSSCTQSQSLRALGLIIGSRRPFILLLSLLLFCSVPYAPFAPHSTIQLTFSIFCTRLSSPSACTRPKSINFNSLRTKTYAHTTTTTTMMIWKRTVIHYKHVCVSFVHGTTLLGVVYWTSCLQISLLLPQTKFTKRNKE